MGTLIEGGPLSEAVYLILLALHQPRHGYGMMQFAQEVTQGRVTLGPGTVYGALNTLLEKQWIAANGMEGDSRKKMYTLTALGRSVLIMEVKRLRTLAQAGEQLLEL